MNKTVTININSIFFHIDENAYITLQQYLQKLEDHFSSTEGKEEIMQDIESRISEILQSKLNDKKNVILPEDINEIISILGKPEDISGDEAEKKTTTSGNSESYRSKRIYRDPDNRILGGVASGIGWYFNVDPVWVRLAFIATFFFAGPLIYIICWIIIPVANSTSEKLEMKGENINISNIENSIKSEFEEVKKRMKDYSKEAKDYVSQSRGYRRSTSGQKVADFAENIIFLTARSFGILMGIIIVGIGLALFIGLLTTIFLSESNYLFSSDHNLHLHNFAASLFTNPSNFGIAITSIILIVGIPIIMIIYNGLKILFGIKKRYRIISWSAFSLWVCGIILGTYSFANIATNFKEKGMTRSSVSIPKNASNSLYLDANINNKEIQDYLELNENAEFETQEDIMNWNFSSNNEQHQIYSYPNIYFKPSESDSSYIQISKFARGRNYKDARFNSENIIHNLTIKDSTILIDKFAKLKNPEIWRNQRIEIMFKLPIGTKIYLGKNMEFFKYHSNIDSELYNIDQYNKIWMMTAEGLKCIDCK